MKLKLLILSFLCLFGLQFARAQDNFRIYREGLSDSDAKVISAEIEKIKSRAFQVYPYEISASWSSSGYIRFYMCGNLEQFVKRLIVNDSRIHGICLIDSVLEIYYDPIFYQFQTIEEMYFFYNELYKCLFSYDQVSGISIRLTDKTNLTFLPTIRSDSWMPMENALLKKKWFIPDIDYVSLLGVLQVEAGDYSNSDYEYITDKVVKKIEEYHNLIEGQ